MSIEVGKVEMPQGLLFFPRLSHFSCLNALQIVVRFWLISRVLKKLILAVFTYVTVFIKEQILRYLYSSIPAVIFMVS